MTDYGIAHTGRTFVRETIRQKVTNLPRFIGGLSHKEPPPPAAPTPETPHQKVFRLVQEGDVKSAARLAARLINDGQAAGFFIYNKTPELKRALEWFHDNVVRSRRGVFAEVTEITPHMGQVLLESNGNNRLIKATSLESAIRDMLAGSWDLNGETVKVSQDGSLNDSQHRNFACVLTGVSYKTIVAFGLLRETRRTVDIGAKRTAGDRAAMAGKHNAIVASATAGVLFEMEQGRRPSARELDEFLDANEEVIRHGIAVSGSNILGVGSAAMVAAEIHLMRLGAQPDRIKEFYSVVRKNEGTRGNNAARTLHLALYPLNPSKTPPLRLKKTEWVSVLCYHFIRWSKGRGVSEPMLGLGLPEAL